MACRCSCRHPPRRARPGLGGARALAPAATTAAAEAGCAGGHRAFPVLDHPYSLAVALAYAGHHPADARRPTRTPAHRRRAARAVRAVRIRLLPRVGAGARRMVPWWPTGRRPGPPGCREPGRRRRAGPPLPTGSRCWPTCSTRSATATRARATLDAAAADARARDDMWWLPEVLRMRAGYDGRGDAVSRLREAAGLAEAQGSVALLRRCARDLAALGVRPDAVNIRSTP